MDTALQLLQDQPPAMLFGGGLALLMAILFVAGAFDSGKKFQESASAAAAAEQELLATEASVGKGKQKQRGLGAAATAGAGGGGGGGKKKKGKNKQSAQAAAAQESSKKKKAAEPKKPEPAPAPAPPPPKVVEEPVKEEKQEEEAPAAAPAKKKKKKKPKKKAASTAETASELAAAEKTAAVLDDDEDEEDDDDLAMLLKNRGKKKPTPGSASSTTNGSSNNNANNNSNSSASARNSAAAAASQKRDSWVTVQKGSKADEEEEAKQPEQEDADAAADPNAVHTVTLTVEEAEKPVVLGPKGATIQAITAESGARLDLKVPTLSIKGTETAIAVAMERVQTLLDQVRAETAHSVTLVGQAQINGSDGIKAIIGKGGATIQSIQETTGCKLDANVEQGKVVITGPTAAQVDQAATLCKHAVFGESQHTVELHNVSTVMLLYGKDYAKIRALEQESGAKLDIPKGTTTLQLSGSTQAVTAARQLVESYLDYCQGETLQIEQSKVGAVYGKGGATIRKIQGETGAYVQVMDNNNNSNSNNSSKKAGASKELVPCQILGEPDAVTAAKEMVLKALSGDLVELAPGEVLETMDLGVGTPAVIGRGGATIRDLESKFKVKLNVQSDTQTCRLVGLPDNIAKCKTEIAKLVAPLVEEARIAKEAERLATEQGEDNAWSKLADLEGAEGW